MKFGEKLIKLRKEKAFSQEDLAEELNVTRQTISKWELGVSKPDMEKLVEISRLFNVGLEDLTNDDIDLNHNGNKKGEDEFKGEKLKKALIIVAILIVILIIIRAVFVITTLNKIKKMTGMEDEFSPNSFISMFFGIADEMQEKFENYEQKQEEEYNERVEQGKEEVSKGIEKTEEWIRETEEQMSDLSDQTWSGMDLLSNFDVSSYNSRYEHQYTGIKSKYFTEIAIKYVVQDNLNYDRKISVKYNDVIYTESNELSNLIKQLNNDEYLISYEKDADGYICRMNIEDI